MRLAHRTDREREYRRTVNRLGGALLLLIGLRIGMDLIFAPVIDVLIYDADLTTQTLILALSDIACCLLAFVLPLLFYRWITPKDQRIPLLLEPKTPRDTALIIPAAMAIIYCAAITNAFLTRFLGLSPGSPSYATPDTSMPPYLAVLSFLATAVIPAFCEELVFRGLVVSQLLPYGKTTAVLGSAVLFGLIHQNYGQFFYATLAGVVLALAVIESGSVWVGVIIHLLNNLISVVGEVFYNRLPYETEMVLSRAIEVLVVGGGLLCLVVLIYRRSGQRRETRDAVRCGPGMGAEAVRGFCSPMMVVFCLLCMGEMLFLAAKAWLTQIDWGMFV